MILERVQVGKVKIDDFLFFGAGSVAGAGSGTSGGDRRCYFSRGCMGFASLARLLLRGCLISVLGGRPRRGLSARSAFWPLYRLGWRGFYPL